MVIRFSGRGNTGKQPDSFKHQIELWRNEYAHADWIGVKKGNFVRVKSQSKKLGIFHRYRKFEIPEIENDIVYIADARRLLCSFNDMIHDQLIR